MTIIDTKREDPFKFLCDVFILFFDESKGHVPLLIFPDESIKNDSEQMRPVYIHSIWFLDVKEQEALDHVDLEYGNRIYFAKKFLATSKRKKRRAGLEEETPETIILMVALPTEMDIFGGDLTNKITEVVKTKFANSFYMVIESEIAKDEIIKTPQIKEKISKGDALKEDIKTTIQHCLKEFFSSVIKQSDSTSLKKQKAISFLMLKGIDISHISSEDGTSSFSDIKLFDPSKKNQNNLGVKQPFQITNVNVIEDSQELEILVKNNREYQMNNITIKISHVKEFFEKEIMDQKIDSWESGEELLFSINIMPHIEEYLFFIIEEDYEGKRQRLVSKKIDINTINKIKS